MNHIDTLILKKKSTTYHPIDMISRDLIRLVHYQRATQCTL